MAEIRTKTDFEYESCWTCRHSRYDIERRGGRCLSSGWKIDGSLYGNVCDDWEQ